MIEKRIQIELKEILDNPPIPCKVQVKDDDIKSWIINIEGPPDSLYEGGNFNLDVEFPETYPFKPPNIYFITKIFHCNINRSGAVCLDILKEQWSPALTISKVVLSISALLADCNPDDPLVPEIANLYKNNRELHDTTVKNWVDKFAKY